jgi:hypothetical protein
MHLQFCPICFLSDPNKEREEAGSLAALGMTTRKTSAKAKAKANQNP